MSASSISRAQQSNERPSPTSQPLDLHKKPRLGRVRIAVYAVAKALGDNPYAVIGGAACNLLGTARVTEDVDIVVPKGNTPTTRSLLQAQTELFDVDKRTKHTWFKSSPPVEIEILAPPGLFKEKFDHTTPTITIDGIKVLKPTLLLNAKCKSILQRGDKKRYSDADDISFLLTWCIEHHCIPTQEEVPNINREFVSWFIEEFKMENHDVAECWKKVGFDVGKDN